MEETNYIWYFEVVYVVFSHVSSANFDISGCFMCVCILPKSSEFQMLDLQVFEKYQLLLMNQEFDYICWNVSSAVC